MNFIDNSCQRFSLLFKSTFHWLLQVYCITQKMHISQLAFLWVTFQCHDTYFSCVFSSKTIFALDKASPWKCKFPDLWLLAWKLNKFLTPFFKPPVNVSLNVASPFIVITNNSSVIFSFKHYIRWSKGAH